MYIYVYTYIHTSTRALTRLVPVTTRVATVSNDFGWRLPMRITRPFGCPLLTCASSCDAFFSAGCARYHTLKKGNELVYPTHSFAQRG